MKLEYIASQEFATKYAMPFLGWTAAIGAQILMLGFFAWAISRVIVADSAPEVASMIMVVVVIAPAWIWISIGMWVSSRPAKD